MNQSKELIEMISKKIKKYTITAALLACGIFAGMVYYISSGLFHQHFVKFFLTLIRSFALGVFGA